MKILPMFLIATIFVTISMNAVMANTTSSNGSILTTGQIQSLFGDNPQFSYNVTYRSGGHLSAGTSNVTNGSILIVERNTTCQSYCNNYLMLEETVASTENPQSDYNIFLQSYTEMSGPNATSVSGTKSGVTYTLFSFTDSYNTSHNLFVGLYGNKVVLLSLAYTSSLLGKSIPSGNLLNSIIQAVTVLQPTISTTTTTTTPTTITTTILPQTTPTQFTTINIKPGWNLLSTPQYLGGMDIENISNIYTSLQNSCGASSNINKALFGYDGSTNSYSLINDLGSFQNYEEYTNSGTSSVKLIVTGGGGYWFYSTKQCSITTTIIPLSKVYSALNGIPFTYSLTAGWNLIGVPFAVTNTFSNISSSCNIRGGFYAYNATTRSYYNATTPVVGNGYFVYASAPCTLNWTPNSSSSSPPSAP